MKYPKDDPTELEDGKTSEEKIDRRLHIWKKWGEISAALKKIKEEQSYTEDLISLKQRRFELPLSYKTISLHHS